jgi:hypothetical protein
VWKVAAGRVDEYVMDVHEQHGERGEQNEQRDLLPGWAIYFYAITECRDRDRKRSQQNFEKSVIGCVDVRCESGAKNYWRQTHCRERDGGQASDLSISSLVCARNHLSESFLSLHKLDASARLV